VLVLRGSRALSAVVLSVLRSWLEASSHGGGAGHTHRRPPAWLTQKYPHTPQVEADGQRVEHGNRAHGSVTSARYREYSRAAEAGAVDRYREPGCFAGRVQTCGGAGLVFLIPKHRAEFIRIRKEWGTPGAGAQRANSLA